MAAPTGRRARVPLALRILIGMGLGLATGLVLGKSAAPLSLFGSLVIDLIKGLAGPYLFCLVVETFLQTRVQARSAGAMVAISLTNASIALLIGLTISNVLQPGKSFQILADDPAFATARADMQNLEKAVGSSRTIDFFKDILGHVPTSFVKPFLDGSILSIVILAVLAGAALRMVKARQIAEGQGSYRVVEDGLAVGSKALEQILEWVIYLVPLAVFGVVAKTVGQYGLGVFRGLFVYLAIGMAGLLIQVGVVYQLWLVLVARMPLKRFWSAAREPIVFAMGVGSSNASIPKTLHALDGMGVSKTSARMAACIGTNLNNDGILLYEAMAVLFVAQAIGVQMTLPQQLLAAASCAIAGIGISGVPEAGLISLVLVLKTVKLPDGPVEEILPILLTVDWVLGRCRAMTNVTSDMLVAVLLDRFDKGKPAIGPAEPDLDFDPALEQTHTYEATQPLDCESDGAGQR
jgi:Na+/H+-dicarboxylate symporter